MKEQFFSLYVDAKIAERYFCLYIDKSVKYDNIVSSILLLTSAATICSWAVWKIIPIFGAVIMASAQVLGALRPQFKYSARVSVAKFLIPEMEFLLDDFANTWDKIGITESISETEIWNLLCEYRKRFTEIKEKYASSELFPENKEIHDKAQNDAATYFSVKYNANIKRSESHEQ